MPIYEYCCQNCGKEFEEWQRLSDPPVDKCRECGGKAKRLISNSTFVLKGTGWYVTDYGRKDGSSSCAPPQKKEAPTESKASETAATSTDS
jgi:putative FmdB family regulatory protein